MSSNDQTSNDINFLNQIDLSVLHITIDELLSSIKSDDEPINENSVSIPSPTLQYDTPNFSSEELPPYEDISEDESYLTNSLEKSYPINIEEWDNTHIMKWILELYDKKNYRYEDLNIHYFRDKTGSCLEDLDESFWKKIDNRRGSWLYKEVQCLIKELKYKSNSISDCGSQTSDEPIQTNVPRKRGRPPKSNAKPRNKEKVGRIWEFLRDLLKDPEYCPRYIRWDNYSNLEFRLVDPRKICEIWGQKKGKVISYEHFSRSIRHYYNLNKDDPESNKAKILSVDRRLVYKFNKDVLEPEDFKQFLKCTENIVHT